jgi:hypothetical protein
MASAKRFQPKGERRPSFQDMQERRDVRLKTIEEAYEGNHLDAYANDLFRNPNATGEDFFHAAMFLRQKIQDGERGYIPLFEIIADKWEHLSGKTFPYDYDDV